MLTTFCIVFYLLNLAIQVKCTSILYVEPKTGYITGDKIVVSCISILDGQVTFTDGIRWIKLSSSSIITSHPEARVRRDGHRLLFASTKNSDEGLYCCSHLKYPSTDHGCTHNSTVRIAVARAARASGTSLQGYRNSDVQHNLVAKSAPGIETWKLEARPADRCVLLGESATVNCLNATQSQTNFAVTIQWFKKLSNNRLELIPNSPARRYSDAHQLRFSETIAEDEGLYCCKAFSEHTCSPTAVVNITVSLPPVLSPLQNHTLLVGETIMINCTATRGESMTFSWQKNGNDLPNELNYSIIQSRDSTTLIITNVTTMDQGYYNCIVKNNKYQKDNESSYLHVRLPLQLPLGCSMVNTSYSITIGLETFTKNCSSIEKTIVHNVINKFLQSICNCSEYCITLVDINCPPDNPTATIIVTLKEKQPLSLKSQVYSTLQEGRVKVKFEDLNYYVFCVVNTLCQVIHTTTPIITPVNTSTEVTEKNHVMIIVVSAITVAILVVLLILIVLCIVANRPQFHKRKQKPKHVTISESNHQISPNSIQLTRSDGSHNERPSTSSNDTGFHSDYNESGSPHSTSSDPFSTHFTENSNTNLPNDTAITNSAVPTVIHPIGNSNINFPNDNRITHPAVSAASSRVNPVQTEHSKHKINAISKHHNNIQLKNESQNIQWSDNVIYSSVSPGKSATVSKSSVTAKEKPHFYDDIECFRAQRSKPTTNYIEMQHPPTVHYDYRVSPAYNNVTINKTETRSLPMTDHTYKNVSFSQV